MFPKQRRLTTVLFQWSKLSCKLSCFATKNFLLSQSKSRKTCFAPSSNIFGLIVGNAVTWKKMAMILTRMLGRGTRRRRPPAWRWTLLRDTALTPWPRPPHWRRRGGGRGTASGGRKGAGPGNGRGFFVLVNNGLNLELYSGKPWRDFFKWIYFFFNRY